MGITVHMELRDFLLLLNYPQGYTAEECIQAAYLRGYKESKETVAVGWNSEKFAPIMEVRDRIRGHIEENYAILSSQTKSFHRIKRRERNGYSFFNAKDAKAYFVPGTDETSVGSWTTSCLSPSCICGMMLSDGIADLTYDSMKAMKPEGWKNHNHIVLLNYLDRFPGKSLLSIVRESSRDRGEYQLELDSRAIRMLGKIAAPEK